MVLVDTSIWVNHLRTGDAQLKSMLEDGEVLCHPFVVGELACGNIRNRDEVLSLLQFLPMAIVAEHSEVMQFIENHQLMGKGLGLIDVNILASTLLSRASLWTSDKHLKTVATKLSVAYSLAAAQCRRYVPMKTATAVTGPSQYDAFDDKYCNRV